MLKQMMNWDRRVNKVMRLGIQVYEMRSLLKTSSVFLSVTIQAPPPFNTHPPPPHSMCYKRKVEIYQIEILRERERGNRKERFLSTCQRYATMNPSVGYIEAHLNF